MPASRNSLYVFLMVLCLAGFAWLYFGLTSSPQSKLVEVCLLKHTTGIPCPSCGSTRSVMAISQGNFIDALKINPLGYVIATIMFLTPLWIVLDLTTGRKTLYLFYRKTEVYLKKPRYMIPVAVLFLINWIWNISKGL